MGRKRRRRRRKRGRRGGVSRRTLVAGLLFVAGGGSLLNGSNAFSQTRARRSTSVDVGTDEDALLGLDVAESVQAGSDGEPLVTITNNVDAGLDASVELSDPSRGSVSPATTTLSSGESDTFAVSVDAESETGDDALAFTVTGTDHRSIDITATRRVDVAPPPTLNRTIRDRTKNNNADYHVAYQVRHVDEFDRVEIRIENGTSGDVSTYTRYEREGTLSYRDGGAQGHTFEFTFEVYAADGRIIEETVTDQAGEGDPDGNDDMGGEDSPELESFSVVDETRNNNTDYTLDYEVSNLEEFERVDVTFEHRSGKDWATQTETNENEPTGTVTYRQGDTENDTYEITVEVINQNGIAVDSGSITDVADGDDPDPYP